MTDGDESKHVLIGHVSDFDNYVMTELQLSCRMQKVMCFHPGYERPMSMGQVLTIPALNARQQVLEDYLKNECFVPLQVIRAYFTQFRGRKRGV